MCAHRGASGVLDIGPKSARSVRPLEMSVNLEADSSCFVGRARPRYAKQDVLASQEYSSDCPRLDGAGTGGAYLGFSCYTGPGVWLSSASDLRPGRLPRVPCEAENLGVNDVHLFFRDYRNRLKLWIF